MHQIAIIGTGYWGPNIVRSFTETGRAVINWLCDIDPARLQALSSKYPQARTTTKLADILADPSVEAVAISTPVATHYEIAKTVLLAGKHVFIEKPVTADSRQAQELYLLARKQEKLFLVGHVFEYNASIRVLKQAIQSGELGDIYYLHFVRTNLGPVRTDVDALWDLAPHDVSIMCYLLDAVPQTVTARGQSFLNPHIADTVFATYSFAQGPLAHVYVSWLNPVKVRQITVVGSKKMALWDDLDLRTPIKIYNKSVQPPQDNHIVDTFLGHKTVAVDGGMTTPPVVANQPLKAECEHFLDCLDHRCPPQSDGHSGLTVVLALEAATQSMADNSRLTPIHVPPRQC